jgi:hypothetical protein
VSVVQCRSGFALASAFLGSVFFVQSSFWVGRQSEVTSTCYQQGGFSVRSCVGSGRFHGSAGWSQAEVTSTRFSTADRERSGDGGMTGSTVAINQQCNGDMRQDRAVREHRHSTGGSSSVTRLMSKIDELLDGQRYCSRRFN